MNENQGNTISQKGLYVDAISSSVERHSYPAEALRLALGFYEAERNALDPIKVSQFNAQQAVLIKRRARRILNGTA